MRTSWVIGCIGVIGCAASGGSRGSAGGAGGGGGTDAGGMGTPESGYALCGDGLDNDGDGATDCADAGCAVLPECSGGTTDGGPPPTWDAGTMECAAVSVTADPITAPVDVVWVIDSSGSMSDEARRVQDNMNAFSMAISASGVDHRVVVMTDPSYVTVPAPLGTDGARYRFVSEDVGSNEPLVKLVSQFSRYGDFLRPEAVVHFVVVTDDESDMSAGDFEARMRSLLGGRTFTLHAIASPGDQPLPCVAGFTGIAAAPGRVYWDLAGRTGGLRQSICLPDWAPIFDALRAAVIVSAALPCAFDVPAPPAGMTFDRTRVNVVYTPAAGAPSTLPHATDPSRCGAEGGWYYDDPAAPAQIFLCPASCEVVGDVATGGRVDIALGCETVLI